MKALLLSALLIASVAAEFNSTSPENGFDYAHDVRNCRQHHVERLNECLIEVIKRVIQPRMGAGIPELNIPRLEPLLLENIEFRQSEPPVTVEAIYKNVLVSGITAFDMKYLDIDMEKKMVYVGLTIPSLTMRGQYKIGGNVFLLPVEGEGDYMTILGDTIHHFLNENGNLVLEEIRPGISAQLNGFLKQLVNSMLSAMPADIFIAVPNSNSKDKHRLRTLSIQAAEAAAAAGAEVPA
ncbi:uncharacterized protein LOC108668756 [Hyalella azteca]|uniref:Uncharacterized protein LOC108668756 n=1 Tax=Hyalella azteca TaxID=294128 RepID=A0A979FFW5_HYAAZ|nr:uncharacterized protein LOC108668756 [Hyalella azteca]